MFKIISDCPRYEINILGQTRNNKTKRILKAHPDKDGYFRVVLWNGKKTINRIVHKLLVQAFLENPLDKSQIRLTKKMLTK